MRCTDCEQFELTLEEKNEEIADLEKRLDEIKSILPWLRDYVNDIEKEL